MQSRLPRILIILAAVMGVDGVMLAAAAAHQADATRLAEQNLIGRELKAGDASVFVDHIAVFNNGNEVGVKLDFHASAKGGGWQPKGTLYLLGTPVYNLADGYIAVEDLHFDLKTRDLLLRFGLVTVGDVAHTPLATLQRAVGAALGSHLHQLAWGTDRRELAPRSTADDPEKSMGANETFGRDTDDRDIISRELLRLSARVTRRMRTGGVAGRTVTIGGP